MNRFLRIFGILVLMVGLVFSFSCISSPSLTNQPSHIIPTAFTEVPDNPNFYQQYDEFNDVYFIYHKSAFLLSGYTSYYNKPISAYIVKSDKLKVLRLVFNYSGDSWIFFNTIILINSSNYRIEFSNIKSYDKDTEVVSGGVKERYDFVVNSTRLGDTKDFNNLLTLFSGSNIRILLSGDKRHTFSIENEVSNGLIELFNYFNSL